MRRVLKISGGLVLAGVMLGGGIVGWMHTHPVEDLGIASTRSGSVPIDASQSDQGTSLSVGEADPNSAGLPLGTSTDGQSGNGGDAGGGGSGKSGSTGGLAGSIPPTAAEMADYEKKYQGTQEAHYIDYVKGTGTEVTAGKKVAINYRGWLTNGKEFDQSYAKGQPYIFTVGERKVIPGFEVGVLGMKVGGRRRLIVPPAGGYGVEAKDGIPANSMLVFDLELMAAQD